ncbi:ShlB/FhaC/HecB family hemolysin secretion/activation protein [Martelella radicis]|uniref:Hemolysin activation/secretion protein n=1 Tax=Martelella radicis TaxID=1397476 RepID=A0A7W6P9V2_9HYPH|nr:ShlB/FhaC/HecB family hemolysin secretion/activation protein [Martelella radicis]MBB4120747.1 hemolysin activation/secretion protein [Martelella radicis]
MARLDDESAEGGVQAPSRKSGPPARPVSSWWGFLACGPLAIGSLFAQTDTALSQTAERIEQTVAGQTTILERFTPPQRVGTVDIKVQDQRKRTPEEDAAAISFTLKSLTVEGAATLPGTTFSDLWQGMTGRVITLADLYRIAAEIDARYLSAGYLAMTVVPVQDFSSGKITLRVYESYVETLEVNSSIPGIRERLSPYIDRIIAMRPIRIKEAERILLLMSDLGGLDIEGILIRPETPQGGGTLRLDIGFDRASGGIGLDNLGTDEVGPLELSGNVTVNDMLGLFDSASLVGVTVPNMPQEMIFLQASQDIPIGFNGLSAGYDLSYITQKPGGDLKADDIDIHSVIGTARLDYPFVRTIDQSLFGRIEVNLRNDRIDVMGARATREQTRWAAMSLTYDRQDGDTAFLTTAEFGQGLGRETGLPEVPEDYRFARLNFDIAHDLGADTAIRLRSAGQYSATPLPAAAQFSLGGDPYGWAFDGGTLSGASGAAAALELSHDFETGWAALPGLTWTTFADYGLVWNEAASADYARDALGSVGVGISGMLAEKMSFQLIAAVPWYSPDNGEDDGLRLFFRLGLPL